MILRSIFIVLLFPSSTSATMVRVLKISCITSNRRLRQTRLRGLSSGTWGLLVSIEVGRVFLRGIACVVIQIERTYWHICWIISLGSEKNAGGLGWTFCSQTKRDTSVIQCNKVGRYDTDCVPSRSFERVSWLVQLSPVDSAFGKLQCLFHDVSLRYLE